jgi:hypothetical protein
MVGVRVARKREEKSSLSLFALRMGYVPYYK